MQVCNNPEAYLMIYADAGIVFLWRQRSLNVQMISSLTSGRADDS